MRVVVQIFQTWNFAKSFRFFPPPNYIINWVKKILSERLWRSKLSQYNYSQFRRLIIMLQRKQRLTLNPKLSHKSINNLTLCLCFLFQPFAPNLWLFSFLCLLVGFNGLPERAEVRDPRPGGGFSALASAAADLLGQRRWTHLQLRRSKGEKACHPCKHHSKPTLSIKEFFWKSLKLQRFHLSSQFLVT